VEYNYPRIKVDWLAAGVFLISGSLRMVNDQICRHEICKFLQSIGSKGLLPWPIRSKRILRESKRNIININFWGGASDKSKSLHAASLIWV
jgi:hypothetical protein